MNIRNANNNIAFIGAKEVKFLTGILRENPARVEELAQIGHFDGITESELKSQEVINAVKKAKSNAVFEEDINIIDRALEYLFAPFRK